MTVAFYDTECYPNYWLFRCQIDGGPIISVEFSGDATATEADRVTVASLFSHCTMVSFNGNYYDVPMISAMLAGYSCRQLKYVNDQIIVEKIKPWELNLPRWRPQDHIDLIEVCPGDGSQKLYAGRVHSRRMQDLPFDPSKPLTPEQMAIVRDYCGNDLSVLRDLWMELQPQVRLRVKFGERFGLDLRSKSDAQMAEAVLKVRCEKALGYRIEKPQIDWNLAFRFEPLPFLQFAAPALRRAYKTICDAVFRLDPTKPKGAVSLPPELDGLQIPIGSGVYRMGIGGLHSSESALVSVATERCQLLMADVASYYPANIINSRKFPPALGSQFQIEYSAIRDERVAAKHGKKQFKQGTPEFEDADAMDGGGKIMINGTFGKTGSPYSVLFAPEMLIQTTVGGQLSLLMLIEWLEAHAIPVISANTDGIVVECPTHKRPEFDWLIAHWEKTVNLTMEVDAYDWLYARDVNNYVALKSGGTPGRISVTDGKYVKRKGDFAMAGLIAKKNPDAEICADAVCNYLANGVPIAVTIRQCADIRKFVVVQRVNGGAVKMHGDTVRKDVKVRDMVPRLLEHGWVKDGRKWRKGDTVADTLTACRMTYPLQRPEYLGKVVRWYYGTDTPGPIQYATNGNLVGSSYGAAPCMLLPDAFPDNVDFAWYEQKAAGMLRDIGAA